MGGSIFVSGSVQVALSTRAFDYLVERVRSQFGPLNLHIIEKVYMPLDEQGMMFISSELLDEKEFAAFSKAAISAMEAARAEEYFSRFETVWNELIDAIRQDARFER